MSNAGKDSSSANDLLKNSSLYREFQAEREEILRHKWIESEKAGCDIGFEQALTDFGFRKYERFHLTASGFSGSPLRSAPELIDKQRVQQIRQSGQGGIVFFSAVYFDNDQTAALVYVNQWCAHLCAAGQWVYLEKKGGQWVRRSGISHGGA